MWDIQYAGVLFLFGVYHNRGNILLVVSRYCILTGYGRYGIRFHYNTTYRVAGIAH